MTFDPQALIAVECRSFQWVRFTFTGQSRFSSDPECHLPATSIGNITGGSLKTPAQEDRESIQAGWFSSDPAQLSTDVPLRAWDCLSLVMLGREWYKEREREGGRPPFSGLPALVGHVSSSLRIIVVNIDG